MPTNPNKRPEPFTFDEEEVQAKVATIQAFLRDHAEEYAHEHFEPEDLKAAAVHVLRFQNREPASAEGELIKTALTKQREAREMAERIPVINRDSNLIGFENTIEGARRRIREENEEKDAA